MARTTSRYSLAGEVVAGAGTLPPRRVKRRSAPLGDEASQPSPPSAGSLARRKRALIDELKSQDVTAERQAAIAHELDGASLRSTPILSHAEIRRLGP